MRIVGAIAVYALLLWLMRPLGIIGIIAALVSGTSAGSIILLARQRDVLPLIRLGTYMFLGMILGTLILGEMMMPRKAYHGPPELAQLKGAIIGLIISAFLAAIVNESRRPPHN